MCDIDSVERTVFAGGCDNAQIENRMLPRARNLVDSDSLDMSFTYNELPILYSMDLTSSLLPAAQQMKDEDCSSYVKRDASFLEPDIRELPLSGDVAKNSTSYSRRFTKAGVFFDERHESLGPWRRTQPANAARWSDPY